MHGRDKEVNSQGLSEAEMRKPNLKPLWFHKQSKMIIQTCCCSSSLRNSSPNVSLSSALSYSPPIQFNPQSFRPRNFFVGVRCSVSQSRRNGTVDFERRPPQNWNVIYQRISNMDKPDLGSATVLNQWEREGKQLRKWELCRAVKELRKYNRYTRALEVYEWMIAKGERFRMSSSDAAIQLDLIGKVRGISSAENFFLSLSESSKDRRIYGSLLHAYVRAKNREKAESILDRMRTKGYATHSLPYNVMMTLYMNINEYEKAESMVTEMNEKKIPLDSYTYNIWLSCRGSMGTVDGMEEVYEKMSSDKTVNPNWTTYSTMATMYINMGLFEKAEEYLRKVECVIIGRNRIPYHYLLSCYGSIGNKEEILRVWNIYKAVFPGITNMGYHSIISSLLRIGDTEEAYKIYEEMLLVKNSYDAKITNLFLGFYVKNGNLEKAISFVDHVVEVGGSSNAGTWEVLASGHAADKKIADALSYWRRSFAVAGSTYWRPRPINLCAFLEICDEEGDLESKEALVRMLREAGYLKDEAFASQIGLPRDEAIDDDGKVLAEGSFDSDYDENKESDSALLLVNEL